MAPTKTNQDISLNITVFNDVFAKEKKEHELTWAQIVERMINPHLFPSKGACPLIKLAEFGDTPNGSGSYRYDANLKKVFGIEVDYDGEEITPEEAAQRLQEKSVEALIYTSASHTEEKPRWRILAPLTRPKSAKERSYYVGLLNGIFEGQLAGESFTASQTYYFGKVNDAYKAIHVEGLTLDSFGDSLPNIPKQEKPRVAIGFEPEVYIPAAEQISSALDAIYANDGYYQPSLTLAALLYRKGLDADATRALIKTIMKNHPNPGGDIGFYINKVDNFLTSPEFLAESPNEANAPYEPDIVNPEGEIQATEFILDDAIAAGIVVLAAAPGAGKSTALVAIAMRAAGLIEDEFEPAIKRRVIIFTEHAIQIEEIVMAMIKSGVIKSSYASVRSMLILANAKRLSLEQIAECSSWIDQHDYGFENLRNGRSYIANPWVIFDTSNANLDLDNENDSQAVGKMLAKIKTEFFIQRGIPVLLSGHTAKTLKHGDGDSLSARGSGAIEGDAHQVIYLTIDQATKARYLEISIPKHRFHAKTDSIKLVSGVQEISAIDAFGDQIIYPVTYVASLESISSEQKKVEKDKTREALKKANFAQRENEFRSDLLDILERWPTLASSLSDAVIPTKEQILRIASGRGDDKRAVFETLVTEGHILAFQVTDENRRLFEKMVGAKVHHCIKTYYQKRNREDGFFGSI